VLEEISPLGDRRYRRPHAAGTHNQDAHWARLMNFDWMDVVTRFLGLACISCSGGAGLTAISSKTVPTSVA
jgi:hypothetical protein